MKTDIIVTSSLNPNFDIEYLKLVDSETNYNVSQYCFQKTVSDEEKVESLRLALADDCDVILACRGGSGAPRLMPLISELQLASKRKKFVGYSDLTVLLNYLNKDPNLEMIHGPMASVLNSKFQIDKYLNAIQGEDVIFETPGKWLCEKPISGQVMGGNLLVLANMIGTFYQPDFNDKILLIEEIEEDLEIVDRLLTKLRDSGCLDNLRGVIVGQWCRCSFTETEINNVLNYYFGNLGIGVLYNINLTHNLNSDYIYLYRDLTITESGIFYQEKNGK